MLFQLCFGLGSAVDLKVAYHCFVCWKIMCVMLWIRQQYGYCFSDVQVAESTHSSKNM